MAEGKLDLSEGKLGLIVFFFRFQQLYDEWKSEGKKFRAIDYSVETPSWAVYGSEERGFDPDMKRHHRNRKNPTYPPGSNAPQG